MAGSTFGKLFKVSTWGESHGTALGVVVDGCPSGLPLSELDIQKDLNRRKPGQTKFSTPRTESDTVEILSGVFEGKTTGTPISLILYNSNHKSSDYTDISRLYRPGHADFGFDMKYGFRDFRGGGRTSGRETSARVAAGAIAKKILKELDIDILTYIISIGQVSIDRNKFDEKEIFQNPFSMPDSNAYEKAVVYVEENVISQQDSAGGVIECVVKGVRPGIGEPVFEKLDAKLGQAILSIGAVKGIEFGLGFEAAKVLGSFNNDSFYGENGVVKKRTNHSGGIIGGLSDGADIVFRAAFKPTSSIAKEQITINKSFETVPIKVEGRHDPLIAPRAVVVVEAMTALTVLDYAMQDTLSKMDTLIKAYKR